jgi:hypothetical protein
MTWVIAAASIFGPGALVSDVGVRFRDGTTADILQKAYPVSNYIAAGFAGSVRIGFDLIESLQITMAIPAGFENHAWDPRAVAPYWGPIAKQIFLAAPLEERRLGSQLLLAGASPTQHMGVPEFPRFEIARFSAPDFIPHFSQYGLSLRHIGSGARVSEYKRALRPLFRITSGIHQAHVVGVHEWARQLAFNVTITVRDNPDHGISEHFHVIGLRLGDMAVFTNDMKTYPKEGPPIELKMPPVARSWAELNIMASRISAQASGAIC